MTELASWLRQKSLDAEAERMIARAVVEAEPVNPATVTSATLAGDKRRLRGVPVVGGGTGGAIAGTNPVAALMRKQPRDYRAAIIPDWPRRRMDSKMEPWPKVLRGPPPLWSSRRSILSPGANLLAWPTRLRTHGKSRTWTSCRGSETEASGGPSGDSSV